MEKRKIFLFIVIVLFSILALFINVYVAGFLIVFGLIVNFAGIFDFFSKNTENNKKEDGKPEKNFHHSIEDKGWRIIKPISESGLSKIFIAENSQRSKYILKEISNEYPQSLDYSVLRLNPNLFALPTYVWNDDNFRYEVIPYIDGWLLSEIINFNKGGIGGDVILSWVSDLLTILEQLHSHDPPIIFCDLKPENILVIPKSFQFMLIDLASATYYKKDTAIKPLGTMGYMAPEQEEGRPTPSSDLYSLAGTIYRMNTGISPPTIFDRKREKCKMKIQKVDPIIALFFREIAFLDQKERPSDAKQALIKFHEIEERVNQYSYSIENLNPIKLPDGNDIPQKLRVRTFATEMEV